MPPTTSDLFLDYKKHKDHKILHLPFYVAHNFRLVLDYKNIRVIRYCALPFCVAHNFRLVLDYKNIRIIRYCTCHFMSLTTMFIMFF